MCKFGYSIHSQLILGVKYSVVFLILVFYTSFSIIFGILEGLFQIFWYSTTPLADPAKYGSCIIFP